MSATTSSGELLVAAPMRIEAALISSAGTVMGTALFAGQAGTLHVRKTGMGPKRSKAAAGQLVGAGAGTSAMLVLGFCGGLDASSVPGEVIVAEEVYAAVDEGHAEERVRCTLHDQLVQRLTGRGMKVRTGAVVCVSRLALGERRAQLHAGGAIAVDMESVWLAVRRRRAPVRRGARRAGQPRARAAARAGCRGGAARGARAAARGGRPSRVGPCGLR